MDSSCSLFRYPTRSAYVYSCQVEYLLNVLLTCRLTPEAIKRLEQDMIKKRQEREEAKKMAERERQIDRQFVDFAHQFRAHKASLKNHNQEQSQSDSK